MSYPIETKTELKPCPFCGGKPILTYYGPDGRLIKCTKCLIQKRQKVLRFSIEWLEEKLIQDWNTRK